MFKLSLRTMSNGVCGSQCRLMKDTVLGFYLFLSRFSNSLTREELIQCVDMRADETIRKAAVGKK